MLRIFGFIALMMILTNPVHADLKSVDKTKLDEMIRVYIEENPEVIRNALQQLAKREDKAQKMAALAFLEMSEGDPVLGNPDGSLVIYEFSDYNCGYCKRVFGPIQEVLAEDDDIRFVIKEFPILAQSSLFAAQAAIATQLVLGTYDDNGELSPEDYGVIAGIVRHLANAGVVTQRISTLRRVLR